MMKRLLLFAFGFTVLLTLSFYLYVWSFRGAHAIRLPSGSYELSIGGIRFPHNEKTNAMVNRAYAPLRQWHAAHLPKRIVDGTVYGIEWDVRRILIKAPQKEIVACQFDERSIALLQTLKEGDGIRATIGWTPGESFILYNHQLDAIAAEDPSSAMGRTPHL